MVIPGITANAGDLWSAITRIEQVTVHARRIEDVRCPPAVATPLPEGIARTNVKFIAGSILLGLGIILLLSGAALLGIAAILFACGMMSGGMKSPEFAQEAARRKSSLDQANAKQQQLFQELSAISGTYQAEFTKRRTELRTVFERYARLDRERAAEIQKLEQKKKELQLRDFLDRQLIVNAGIQGIGPGRIATLQAYGVESALDVTPHINVLGIGETYTSRLLSWRRHCETRFHFNAAAPIPPQEIHQLDVRINTMRNNLVSDLKQGPQILANLGAAARSRVLQLEAQIDVNTKNLAQASADVSVLY